MKRCVNVKYICKILLYSRTKKLCRLEIVSVCKRKKNVVVQYAEEKGIIVNEWPLENNPQDFHIGIVVSFGHLIPLNIINSFPL